MGNDINDELCEEFSVDGFPTLKWGSRDAAEDYDGGRDYASMAAFAKEHITKLACSMKSLDACTNEEKKDIETVQSYSDDRLKEIVQIIKDTVKAEEKKLNDAVNELQKEYDRVSKEHTVKIDAVKAQHQYKFLTQVMKQRGIQVSLDSSVDDDDDDDD